MHLIWETLEKKEDNNDSTESNEATPNQTSDEKENSNSESNKNKSKSKSKDNESDEEDEMIMMLCCNQNEYMVF